MSDEPVEIDHESHEVPVEQESNVVAGAEATPEKVTVTCQGCQTKYPFDIDSTVDGFVFDCAQCKARNAWTRAT